MLIVCLFVCLFLLCCWCCCFVLFCCVRGWGVGQPSSIDTVTCMISSQSNFCLWLDAFCFAIIRHGWQCIRCWADHCLWSPSCTFHTNYSQRFHYMKDHWSLTPSHLLPTCRSNEEVYFFELWIMRNNDQYTYCISLIIQWGTWGEVGAGATERWMT